MHLILAHAKEVKQHRHSTFIYCVSSRNSQWQGYFSDQISKAPVLSNIL